MVRPRRMLGKIKYMAIVAMCLTIVMIFSQGFYGQRLAVVEASTEDDELLRIGLEGIYYNKSYITVRNTDIIVGYSVANTYYEEVTLTGGGYTVKPFTENFKLEGRYDSYDEVAKIVVSKAAEGEKVYPCLMDRGVWAIAIVGEGDADKYAVSLIDSTGNGIIYTVNDNSKHGYPQLVAATGNKNGVFVIDLGERQYRGRMEIGRYGGANSLKAVNIVTMEKYLYGVVPCEMVYAWHEEALKAQAICARSYAYMAGYGGDSNAVNPYKICDTTSSQVYKGYGAERQQTNKAVDETSGELVYYNGRPVRAYYSSTSGGSTENVEDVWGTPYGYLRQVSDIYELDPELKPWIIKVTESEMLKVLAENGISMNNIEDIRPSILTASGRVYSVEITGDKKEIITGSKLRKILSLYSTKYKVVKYSDNPDYVAVLTGNGSYAVDIADSYIASGSFNVKKASGSLEQFVVMTADNLINYPAKAPSSNDEYYIAGMGYGHGIGMSQSGAKGMAEAGFTYKEILKHYFTGAEIY